MKHYLYLLSESKINTLWLQIPEDTKETIVSSLNIDRDYSSPFSKVRIITSYIMNYLDVGTSDEPRTYFSGSLPMKMGLLPKKAHEKETKELTLTDYPYVYFGGETEKRVIALVGSAHRFLGQLPERLLPDFESDTMYMPNLMRSIAIGTLQSALNRKEIETTPFLWDCYSKAMQAMNHQIQNPPQKLKFLAKRLVEDSGVLVLGAPIYVALADQLS